MCHPRRGWQHDETQISSSLVLLSSEVFGGRHLGFPGFRCHVYGWVTQKPRSKKPTKCRTSDGFVCCCHHSRLFRSLQQHHRVPNAAFSFQMYWICAHATQLLCIKPVHREENFVVFSWALTTISCPSDIYNTLAEALKYYELYQWSITSK